MHHYLVVSIHPGPFLLVSNWPDWITLGALSKRRSGRLFILLYFRNDTKFLIILTRHLRTTSFCKYLIRFDVSIQHHVSIMGREL